MEILRESEKQKSSQGAGGRRGAVSEPSVWTQIEMSKVTKVYCVVWAQYETRSSAVRAWVWALQSDQNINYEGTRADRSHKPDAE